MSHPYITSNDLEDPLRSAHQKILEDEHVMNDHTHKVLSVCRRVVTLARDAIERGDIEKGNYTHATIQVILA